MTSVTGICRDVATAVWNRDARELERMARTAATDAMLRSPVASPHSRELYSALAPRYYRRRYQTDIEGPVAPDPFKRERVDPARVERFTRRVYPPWRNRRQLFGTVRSGDWDRRPHADAPTDGGPPRRLFVAGTIEDTLLFRSLDSHFNDGIPWAETKFVQEVLNYLAAGREHVWHDCESESDVYRRCRRLDAYYRTLSRDGCESQAERIDVAERERGFLDVLENEIIVDIGRDGELLLVSGKHRLCLSRLLELPTVPVAFLVRHGDWIATRRAVADGESVRDPAHPDLRDLLAAQSETSANEVVAA
ncbi:MAG: hypothetical protein R6U01_06175 [Halorubrum sp.]|uniref:hypothetical protein n=1 Tax=Halorubrum sp. TaxID=1879286 RepID=UPI003970C2FC